MKTLSYLLLCLTIFGCNATPIPQNAYFWHAKAHREAAVIREVIEEGDIVFRLSNTQLAGGLFDFSKEVAKATQSDFSHAVLVYRVEDDGVILADVTPRGLERRYLIDWYLDPSKNVVITRLKPEYQFIKPMIMAKLKEYIEADPIYDTDFVPFDKQLYCTELVDEIFREVGYPLADRIKIKDFPESKILFAMSCLVSGVDIETETVVAGNERFGLFSSPMLEVILDLRTDESKQP